MLDCSLWGRYERSHLLTLLNALIAVGLSLLL